MRSEGEAGELLRLATDWSGGRTAVFGRLCEVLWERLYGPIFRYARSLGLPADTASDAVADGFWKAVTAFEGVVPGLLRDRVEEERLAGWFYRAWSLRIRDEARGWHGRTRRVAGGESLESLAAHPSSRASGLPAPDDPETAFVRKRELREMLARLESLAVDRKLPQTCRQLVTDTLAFIRLRLLACADPATAAELHRYDPAPGFEALVDRVDLSGLELDSRAWREFLRGRLAERQGINVEDAREAVRLQDRVDQRVHRCREQLGAALEGLV